MFMERIIIWKIERYFKRISAGAFLASFSSEQECLTHITTKIIYFIYTRRGRVFEIGVKSKIFIKIIQMK